MSETEAAAPQTEPLGSPWQDLRAYIATPRVGGLTLSPDGQTLLAAVSTLDAERTAYRTALWRVDTTGEEPARRLTRSVEGEASAAFLPAGPEGCDLLFTSKRALPTAGEDEPSGDTAGAIWCLPAGGGEAYEVARRDGGWSGITTARTADVAVLGTPMFPGAIDDAADAARRKDRSERKIHAILHDGYPVRFWDHDLGPEQTRLSVADLSAAARSDRSAAGQRRRALVGDVGPALGGDGVLSDDGSRYVVSWRRALPYGDTATSLVSIDVATGERTTLAEEPDAEFGRPVLSPDGETVVCVREQRSTAATCPDNQLFVIGPDGEGRRLATDWDAWPTPFAVSPDGATCYVTVDEQGSGPVYAVDLATGSRRRLTAEVPGGATYLTPVLSPDGATVFAVRSSYADPGTVVAIDTSATDGVPRPLRLVDYPDRPGTVERVATTAVDGTPIGAWLLRPAGTSAEHPAPLVLWVHGGPLGSWNAWSWRWCPWLLVSEGYAVLLPDPALSTGYGRDFVQRGWGRWGAEPYTDLMSCTDQVLQRADIDADRPLAMGGSFGGYMANWVAGHTDRFAGIVTHASLWNLETFGATTDSASYWAREMTPAMREAYSPHRHADAISTPMLVVHGDKDYRVPIGEGLSLWWELCSRHAGDPAELPHRFLYFPDENHWVLTPQHAVVWYETVRAFATAARDGGNMVRPESL